MADLDGDVKSGLTGLTCKLRAERPVGSGMSRTVGKLSAVGAAGTRPVLDGKCLRTMQSAGWQEMGGGRRPAGARSRGAIRPGKDTGFYECDGKPGRPPGED